MEDRKANVIALLLVAVFTITIIVARVVLGLSKTFFLICGANVAAILAVFTVVAITRHYNRRRKLLEKKLVSEGRELRVEYSFLRKVAGVPTKFRYKELEDATDGFRSLLGRGASASVFKGFLSGGTPVAVKRIVGDERGEKEFRSEVAAIASVQHVNLLRLLGYCSVPSGPRFLIYEFIHNGSLDNWIFPRKEIPGLQCKGGCLSWDLRCKVAINVARALAYLHHDCRSCILHLDVKPENILLDERFRALVADFGLSKLMGKDESRVMTTVRGTKGYLAPEWILENGVSEKCDVYGFGMVLLEMIGGRRNVCVIEEGGEDRDHKPRKKFQCFSKIASEKLKEGKVMEIVDQRLVQAGGVEEWLARRLVCVALWCLQDNPKIRPSMAEVVEMLEGRVALDEPPDTQMLVVDLLLADAGSTSTDGVTVAPRLAAVGLAEMDRGTIPSTSGYSFAISVLSGR